uniref:Ribosomal protein L23 n=1 Tax=Rhodochaete parvula TaxID=110510 RepID=A0A1C9CIA9_9RHOD|nr:ribosomal protein L23 [Rhodochaete parvula]ARO91297.1 50S ribosomal protein L23 [Rhodochaete parvula]
MQLYKKISNLIYFVYPIITDKTAKLMENNEYSFAVDVRLSKGSIKKSIEDIFNVKVIGINTLRPPKKQRKVGKFSGYSSNYKKAIIKLAKGDSINLF